MLNHDLRHPEVLNAGVGASNVGRMQSQRPTPLLLISIIFLCNGDLNVFQDIIHIACIYHIVITSCFVLMHVA